MERAARCSAPGDRLLDDVVVAYRHQLTLLLGVGDDGLRGFDMESPLGRAELLALVRSARARLATQRSTARRSRATEAARLLSATSRSNPGGIELDVERLFALVSSASAAVLRLEGVGIVVHVSRALLVRARPILERFEDLTASLDTQALHLRWRDGRGALHHRCPAPTRRDQPAFPVWLESTQVPRSPVLIAEVLHDLGLTA